MEMITIDELGAMMAREFSFMHKRFDRVEIRLTRVEETVEDIQGTLISMDDRISRIEYTLDEANPRKLKKRVEKLEKQTFGVIQPA